MPFVRQAIAHRKRRTAVAVSGITFAILVVFVQLGFYGAVVNTALAISSKLDADVLLVSPRFVHLSQANSIPRVRLFQTLALSEVVSATPLYLRYARWREPLTGESCKLFALGFPLISGAPLVLPGIEEQLGAIEPSNTLLADTLTQPECGPFAPDGAVEVREQVAHVTGRFELGVGFLGDGAILMSDDTFARLFSSHSLDRVHLGLVKLAPGVDPELAAGKLREILPEDTRVVSRGELQGLLERHWVENTAVGNIFGMGTVAGFFVGVVVLFQVLSADIRTQLPLYATLKAMGYRDTKLYRYVLEQSWVFALLGFVPALIVTSSLFPLIRGATNLPVFMTPGLAGFVLVLSLGMCTLAGTLSLRRISTAEPAELF